MHPSPRSHPDPVPPTPTPVTLPPELWELVCSFLPNKEVCRLRSLDSCFFAAALAIHYRTLTIETTDQPFESLALPEMGFISDVRNGEPYRRQYTLKHVRALCLVNGADDGPFYTSKTKKFDFDFQIVFAADRVVEEQLGCLRNVQTLQVKGQPFSPTRKVFGSILIHSVAQTLMHLDLDLVHLDCLDLSNVGDAVLCPNVRSLKLRVTKPDETITVPLPTFLNQGIQRIHSLVPSDIESLELKGDLHSDLSSSSTSLALFNQLKKLICTKMTSATAGLPFAIPELINANAETLVDIKIDLTTLLVEHYETLSWGEQGNALSLSGLLLQLEKCENLRKFSLEGYLIGDPVDSKEFSESLLKALSKSATQLNDLEIPFHVISPQIVWNIFCAFPNLDNLIFHGVAEVKELLESGYLFRFGPSSYPRIWYHSIQSDIHKEMAFCSSSEFWHKHAKCITNRMTRYSKLMLPHMASDSQYDIVRQKIT